MANVNKTEGRVSGTTAAVQKGGDADWTDVCACFSSCRADFQCAICSAEETTNVFWKLALTTTWSVPFSNYRQQHTCTDTHTGQTNVHAKLNIDILLQTRRSLSQTQKHVDCLGQGFGWKQPFKNNISVVLKPWKNPCFGPDQRFFPLYKWTCFTCFGCVRVCVRT